MLVFKKISKNFIDHKEYYKIWNKVLKKNWQEISAKKFERIYV